MTAQQLIDLLRQCDPLSPVYVFTNDESRRVLSVDDNVSSITIIAEDEEE